MQLTASPDHLLSSNQTKVISSGSPVLQATRKSMAVRGLCALALLCVSLTHASSQKVSLRNELQTQGYTHFLALAEAAGITSPAPSAVLTIFAPTNQAIDAFLQKMKLSLDDIKGRPGLAAAVVAYHVLPRVKGRTADVKNATKEAPLEAITADNAHFLQFYMGPNGKVVVQDVQNNTASFVTAGKEVNNVMLYGIDKVLLSGDVFYTLADLLSMHPQFRPLRELYAQAQLEAEVQALQGGSNTITIWAPTAEAVQSARPQLMALSKSDLQDVLRYHIVPAALPIPAGLEADKAYPTAFKGHTLRFKYNRLPSKASKHNSLPKSQQQEEMVRKTVEVIPEAGTFSSSKTANITGPTVTLANLFANRMIIHGINHVLRPHLPSKTPPAQPSAPQPAVAAPPGQQAAAAPPAATTRSGRKLLQFRGGTGPSTVSAGLTATQSAIRAAVAGRQGADDAAAVGGMTARSAASRCWNCVVDSLGD